MRTFKQWQDLVSSAVMLRGDDTVRNAIAFMCWSDEQSGGQSGVWHASAVYHGYKCHCYHCVGTFLKSGSYPGRTGEMVFA